MIYPLILHRSKEYISSKKDYEQLIRNVEQLKLPIVWNREDNKWIEVELIPKKN